MKKRFAYCLLCIIMIPVILMYTSCSSKRENTTGTSTVNETATVSQTENSTAEEVDIEEEYHWTAAMSVAETTINYMMVEKFAQLINERSGGKITVDIYPGGQMGNTTEFTEAVIGGSIQIGTGMTTDLVDFIPVYGIFDMPNLFDDTTQMRGLLNSDFVDLLNDYCHDGGIHMLGYSDAGFRQLTTNKAVHSLKDLKGQKIRVMTNKYHIEYWNELGASATPMQFTEVFMGLQQGTIDGEENPYMNIVGNNIQEVQDYIIETNHIGHIITFFMNNNVYNNLPDDVRTLVDECARDAVEYANSQADESIAEYKKICEDAGCQIITLDDATISEIRDKAEIVYDMVRKDLGDDIVDQLMSAIQDLE